MAVLFRYTMIITNIYKIFILLPGTLQSVLHLIRDIGSLPKVLKSHLGIQDDFNSTKGSKWV